MLKDTVPKFVAEMTEMAELFQAEQPELDQLKIMLTEMVNQFYIKCATYSLDMWETEFNIKKNPNMSTTQRRGQVLAKLNTASPASVAMLENLVQQVLGAERVMIEEHPEDYNFDIYINTKYIAENLKIADKAVYEARPAHLSYKFVNELIRKSQGQLYVGIKGVFIKIFNGEVERYRINRNINEVFYIAAYAGCMKIFNGEVRGNEILDNE